MALATDRAYHHGDLRRTLLTEAVAAIAESGPSALSLRELARRAGVSHAAPAHHFGDKAGLLTAIAVEGYARLADALSAALAGTGTGSPDDQLLEIGVAYVRFAVEHRAYFEVMFRPDLYHRDDPRVVAGRERTGDLLRAGLAVKLAAPSREAGLAAWSIVHGFATLWLGGALPADVGEDPEAAARAAIRLLFD